MSNRVEASVSSALASNRSKNLASWLKNFWMENMEQRIAWRWIYEHFARISLAKCLAVYRRKPKSSTGRREV
jgi:hypothetical protein